MVHFDDHAAVGMRLARNLLQHFRTHLRRRRRAEVRGREAKGERGRKRRKQRREERKREESKRYYEKGRRRNAEGAKERRGKKR